jgi:hypothetical protein
MKRLVTLACAAALLVLPGACATTAQWSHPSKTQADLAGDRGDCGKAAERDAYGSTVVNSRAFEECMKQRGWQRN